jgi:colicin import membrane protein
MATMNPAAAGVPYRVPPEPSRLPSIGLAAVVHAGLLCFLWFGISWQNTEPVAVEAEVWDMKVQPAAVAPPPQVVEPEPAPKVEQPPVEEKVEAPPPDIALEKQKKLEKLKKEQERRDELAEKKRIEKEEADKKLAEKKEKAKKLAEEQKKLDKLRDAEMRRITGAVPNSSDSAKSTGPKGDPSYYAAISAKIRSNLVYAGSTDVPGNPEAVYRIDQLPTGEIISAVQVKSSGIPAYDEAVKNAIAKSSPLPRKKDGTVERSIPAAFKLKDSH